MHAPADAATNGIRRDGEARPEDDTAHDDAQARPSIINDDQEFALLTRHDEYLLRILYDPRLEYGMTAAEGMPVVRRIVEEIGPGPARAPSD